MISKGWYTYVLQCSDGTFYTGATNDIESRLRAHRFGRGAKYTRGRLPIRVLYVNWMESKSEALKEERRIKKMTRAQKLDHITAKREKR